MNVKKALFGFVAIVACLEVSILLHELGHYTAAKICGVYCPWFRVGIGPSIKILQTGETEWEFGAFPLMGGVGMLVRNGDDGDETVYNGRVVDGRSLDQLSRGELLMVMGAGPLVNFLLGIGALLGMLRFVPKEKRPSWWKTIRMIGGALHFSAYHLIVGTVTFGRYPARTVLKSELEAETEKAELEQKRGSGPMVVTPAEVERKKKHVLPILRWYMKVLLFFAFLNFLLGMFNLLPIAGLDGYWIFSAIVGIEVRTAMSWIPKDFMTYFLCVMVAHAIIYYLMPRKVVIVDDTLDKAEAKV